MRNPCVALLRDERCSLRGDRAPSRGTPGAQAVGPGSGDRWVRRRVALDVDRPVAVAPAQGISAEQRADAGLGPEVLVQVIRIALHAGVGSVRTDRRLLEADAVNRNQTDDFCLCLHHLTLPEHVHPCSREHILHADQARPDLRCAPTKTRFSARSRAGPWHAEWPVRAHSTWAWPA